VKVAPAAQVLGHVAVPGDKSISHRAVLLGALSEEDTHVRGFGRAGDTESTIAAVRTLGADVDELGHDELVVRKARLSSSQSHTVDCGNSGTLMRLLAGLLVGQTRQSGQSVLVCKSELVGDDSLTSRPMERIAEPLRRMGGDVETTDGHAPLVIRPAASLKGIEYTLPVASAQVKSAVLLAGLAADGATTVVEPAPTRDHTELMLESAGVRVRRRASSVTVEPASTLQLADVEIPGDFSSAAPLLAAVALIPGSDLTVHDLGLNPRRTGFLAVLERMGARIAVFNRRKAGREHVGDVQIEQAELVAVEVGGDEVPLLVDELPLVALLASHARGTSIVRGAEELRVKETDRIDAVTAALRACGARVREREDGWEITGVPRRLRGGRVDARGDHRIAMLGAIAGLASREGVDVLGAEMVAISFPGFFELLDSVIRR
jgi:3-phosphoshikimate 1-carboxyvinyltransferase